METMISYPGTPLALGMSLEHFGRTAWNTGEQIWPHIHNNYEFHIVESGSVIYMVDEHSYPMSIGDICITRPGEYHGMLSSDNLPWSVAFINIRQMPPGESEMVLRNTAAKVIKGCRDINPLFEDIFTEAKVGQLDSTIAVHALSIRLLIAIVRRLKSAEPTVFQLPYSQIVIKVLDFFGANCRYTVSIGEISHAIGLSPSRLSHVFKEETGWTIRSYLRNMLMERAKRMLEDDAYTVTEISRRLDFPRIACFSDFFRKHEGHSPSSYKIAWKGHTLSHNLIRQPESLLGLLTTTKQGTGR